MVIIIGVFYAASKSEESVLAMASNEDNSLLVTGDTRGQLTLWNIQQYCTIPSDKVSLSVTRYVICKLQFAY